MTRSGMPRRPTPYDDDIGDPPGIPTPIRRSGTPTTPNAKRTRPMVTLTLSHEALARLDAIASERGQTRSGAVEQLVRNARLRVGD
jgi:hypothetical protein